jgi:hypothetical protein
MTMSDPEKPEDGIQVPVVWAGVEDVPIVYANNIIVQFDTSSPGGFIITVGQMTPPALIGTPEEVREQAEQVSFVPVRAVARLALTRTKMQELIAVLQGNVEKYDRWQSKVGGDPRGA